MSTFLKRSILLVSASIIFPGVAAAGLFDDDKARKAILDLRAKLEAVNTRLDTKLDTKTDKTTTLNLANDNEALRAEIAKLRGQLEVLANDLANAQRRQQDFYIDLDNRMRKLEPKRVQVDGREAIVEVAEQRNFDQAMSMFKEGDYKSAVQAFTGFLSAYPQSAYAGSAQYWLGNSYYAQRDCKGMIATLQQLVKSQPEHAKAPDAILNIAICHAELKEKVAARKTLESLIAQYPQTEAAQVAKSKLASLK